MSTKIRTLLITALVAAFGFAFAGSALAQLGDMPGMETADAATAGGLEAPALGELGDTTHGAYACAMGGKTEDESEDAGDEQGNHVADFGLRCSLQTWQQACNILYG
jgi:hypothetical protein